MDRREIAFSPPDIGEAEIAAVGEVLRSGWITTGPKTKEFESKLAEYIFGDTSGKNALNGGGKSENNRRVACLSSATAAEELILRVLGIGKGDQVIVPAYTYTATAAAAVHVGAEVVFVDSQKDSFEMDYDAVERAVTPATKAIIPVDISGVVCDYERLFQIAENTRERFIPSGEDDLGDRIQRSLGRVAIIADCAHAIGAKRKIAGVWKNAGDIADFSSFSFHAVKNLTTAEGGAAVWRQIDGIEDEEIYRQFQLLSLHGQNKDALAKTERGGWEYDIIAPYFKCNMTNIMAAIGVEQLKRYPALLARRRQIIEKYDEAMDASGIWHVKHFTDQIISSGHLYQTRIPGIDEHGRNQIIAEMAENGIACNVHYKPLPMMTAYRKLGWRIEDFPNSYRLYENLITLPLHTKLSDTDIKYILDMFHYVVNERKGILNV